MLPSISFQHITPAKLRQWVEENPGHIEDWDCNGMTALCKAAWDMEDVALVQWLIDTQGANANSRSKCGLVALHGAMPGLMVRTLLERNADPTLVDDKGRNVLMTQLVDNPYDCIVCLLEDRRVMDMINTVDRRKFTALHVACKEWQSPATLQLLLRAGADPFLQDVSGETPMDILLEYAQLPYLEPEAKAYIAKRMAVLQEGMDAQRAACLLRIRRSVVVRQKKGVELKVQEEQVGNGEAEWERMLAFVLGLGGGNDCPFFTVLMDFLLPVWSPLRIPLGGYGEVWQVSEEEG
jgi:hypothetical protein